MRNKKGGKIDKKRGERESAPGTTLTNGLSQDSAAADTHRLYHNRRVYSASSSFHVIVFSFSIFIFFLFFSPQRAVN